MKYGYARVSTFSQDLESQFQSLEKEGCDKIYSEKFNGTKADRPQCQELLSLLEEGDTNMGNDSDTIAAIAGGLKGLEVGFNKLPPMYRNKLLDNHHLQVLAEVLYEIRDKDTVLLKENPKTYLLELESQTNEIII